MTMGTWKTKKAAKARKGSQTAGGGKARTKFCTPPEGGWPGGDPAKNGYKAGGK